jgi:hypothetical protein
MLELLRIRPRVVRPPIPVSEVGAGGQGVRGAPGRGPAHTRAAARRAGPGRRRIPRLPGPAGKMAAGPQGVRVVGAGHPLAHEEHRREQLLRSRNIGHIASPARQSTTRHGMSRRQTESAPQPAITRWRLLDSYVSM